MMPPRNRTEHVAYDVEYPDEEKPITYAAMVAMAGSALADLSPKERAVALLPKLPDFFLAFAAFAVCDDRAEEAIKLGMFSLVDFVMGEENYYVEADTEKLAVPFFRLCEACVLELGRRRGLLDEATVRWDFNADDASKVEFRFRHPLARRLWRYVGERKTVPMIEFLAHLSHSFAGEYGPVELAEWMFKELPREDCALLIRDVRDELTAEEREALAAFLVAEKTANKTAKPRRKKEAAKRAAKKAPKPE